MTRKMFMMGAILLLLALVSVSGVHAQGVDSNVTDVSLKVVDGYICLSFTVRIDGLGGHKVRMSGYPVYESGEYIKNNSGDKEFTDPDGYVTVQEVYDVGGDAWIWDKATGDGVSLCFNEQYLPLSESSYEFHLRLFLHDDDSDQPINGYDTRDDFGLSTLTYTSDYPALRITHITYDFNAKRGNTKGISIGFTIEIAGYNGESFNVAVYPVEEGTQNYLKSMLAKSQYTTTSGQLTSQTVVTANYDYSVYKGSATDENKMNLFIPYTAFPRGTYKWHPYFNVFPAGEKVSVYAYEETDPNLVVQMK